MLDSQSAVKTEEFCFPSGDTDLSARLYLPHVEPSVVVVLNGATAVSMDFYKHFATWLAAENGMACLTYDYRDFGRSLKGRLQDAKSKMSDWALIDMPAARAEMRRRFPNAKLWVIGHSIGAMMVPLQSGIEDIDRMICVSAGLVSLPDHPWPYRALATTFWYGHAPLLVGTLGYLPGRFVGFGADLPPHVYWEWRKWCTSPGCYLSEIGHSLPEADWSRSGARTDVFTFSDDQVAPTAAVWRLADLYEPAVNRHLMHPKDFGLKQVGHFGAFARRNSVIWPKLIE